MKLVQRKTKEGNIKGDSRYENSITAPQKSLQLYWQFITLVVAIVLVWEILNITLIGALSHCVNISRHYFCAFLIFFNLHQIKMARSKNSVHECVSRNSWFLLLSHSCTKEVVLQWHLWLCSNARTMVG